jgi:hypothetical protein
MNLQQCSAGSYKGGEEVRGGGEVRRVTIGVRHVYYGDATLLFSEIREILVAIKKLRAIENRWSKGKGLSLVT